MRRARAVALLFLAAAVLASSAQAAEPVRVAEFVQGRDRYEGPAPVNLVGDAALSGGRAVWTQRLLDGSWGVEMAAPGERPIEVATSPRVMPGVHTLGRFGALAPGLVASPQRVAWSDYSGHQTVRSFWATNQDRLLTATPRPRSRVELLGCSSIRGCPHACSDCFTGSRHFAAVDGYAVAYADQASHALTIHRPGAPDVQLRTDPRSLYGISSLYLAGRYVAWQDAYVPPNVGVVYDLQAGREVYRVPSDELIAGIQADGKLLTGTAGKLRWRALPDETPHDIAIPGAAGVASFAGDAVAFFTSPGGSSTWGPPVSLGVSDLAGHAHLVAEGAWAPAYSGFSQIPRPSGVGFDGRRLTWIAQPCGVATVMEAQDAATTTSPAQPRCAAPRIEDFNGTTRPTKTIRRDGRAGLAVRLACPSGCRGTLDVSFIDDVPLKSVGSRGIDLPPSDHAITVHVRPSKRAARLLRKHRIVERDTFGTV
ncbi:MAG: hypothetical protein ACJ768_12880, partial [Gaiellaceae bacterium]